MVEILPWSSGDGRSVIWSDGKRGAETFSLGDGDSQPCGGFA